MQELCDSEQNHQSQQLQIYQLKGNIEVIDIPVLHINYSLVYYAYGME